MKSIRNSNLCLFFCLTCTFLFLSCQDFVDVELTGSKVPANLVFADDNTASSAVVGLYYDMSSSVIATGSVTSLGRLASLSSDELYDYGRRPDCLDFENSEIRADNPFVLNLWNALYKVVYDANSIIEGLDRSDISYSVKRQLKGEAIFVRSFCYFNLVNFFGDVPLVLTTDYVFNSTISKSDRASVYNQIVSDLTGAKELLNDEYPNGDRTRVNRQTAAALLAKVYLHLKDWRNAAIESSLVIDDLKYGIVSDLNGVFQLESEEAIWQIAPVDPLNMTDEARFYVITSRPRYLVLRSSFVESFDESDLRRSSWINYKIVESNNIYYPFKYKTQLAGDPIREYSVVFRLAEQYLIRAEARTHLGEFDAAIVDLDTVRTRAGLPRFLNEMPDFSEADLLEFILNERKFELFTEWGARWFDLKRLDLTREVLFPIKPKFTIDDALYPLPALERERNPSLGEQNPGY